MTTRHYTLGLFPLFRNSYRRFCWPWWKEYLNPKTYWQTLKYFCQRGYRGYAACDHWDADSYLEGVIFGVIRDLRAKAHGFPAHLSDHTPGEEPEGEYTDSGAEKWDKILGEIIEGLEAAQELRHEDTVPEGTYSDEPLEWEEVEGSDGKLMQMKHTDTPRFNADLYEQWAEPLRQKRARGFELLVEYWGNFWD